MDRPRISAGESRVAANFNGLLQQNRPMATFCNAAKSSIVILFGAQLNSEIEHHTARDSTVEHDKPLGARGAVMADTVGAAV
jgi:hypothetical protein